MIKTFLLVLLLAPLAAAPAGAAPAASTDASRQAQAEYLRGTLLERRGAYSEALDAYEKAMALDPSAAFIAGEAAELALQLDDRDRAEKWARKRLELAPNDAKSRVILARVLWARGDTEGAEAQFALALKDDPSSADNLFALTELISARDPERARKLLGDFLKRNPESAARVLFELGRLDAQQARYPDAVAKLKRSIELDDSESDPARLALAQIYEVTNATADAVAEYQRLLEDDPDDVELWAHIGELQAAMGALGDARDTFKLLKEKHPGNPAACAWLAGDAENAGDFKAAAAALQDSAALKDDPTLNLRLGYYQLQAGSMKEAMATLMEARRRWPKDDRVAYYLALGRDDQGDDAAAVKLLREVLADKPDDRDARWQLATILEKMNDIGAAEPEFRRLIADKPDDAPAMNYLGYSLADRGLKLADAESLIRRALVIEPSNPAYRDSLGWVLFKEGRSTEAVTELVAAVRALPDDDSVWGHLGDARKAVGNDQGAWQAWRLSQSFGGTTEGAKADALQKGLSGEAAGELWRAHLESVQGGVRRFRGLCEVKGKIRGHPVSQQAMLTFRAPDELTLEILGPLFSPVARASIGAGGFSMDQFPVEGLTDEQVRGATEGVLSVVDAVLGGAPYAPGITKLDEGWGRRELDRPGWRVELGDDALARAVKPAGGAAMTLGDFEKVGARRIPTSFSASGHSWEFSLTCPQAKIETVPDLPPLETP
ncbi:MAG TPA: tetratricopeptide repeat protein [Elusimicrobiota bacterium]|jgi:tetratricopeptide (TPR) repeat protein|nr:tetratricopeptide repeat protein [Elusimicrobiota bacterium]